MADAGRASPDAKEVSPDASAPQLWFRRTSGEEESRALLQVISLQRSQSQNIRSCEMAIGSPSLTSPRRPPRSPRTPDFAHSPLPHSPHSPQRARPSSAGGAVVPRDLSRRSQQWANMRCQAKALSNALEDLVASTVTEWSVEDTAGSSISSSLGASCLGAEAGQSDDSKTESSRPQEAEASEETNG